MPKRIVFSSDQLEELRRLISGGNTQQQIAEHFGTTDTIIRRICKENNIECKRVVRTYECCVCHKEFRADRKSAICPECKATPLVCVVCGKEFPRKYYPYDQKTCSAKCRGIYMSQSGIAKAASDKVKATKLEKYGSLDPAVIAKANSGGQLAPKICPLCHKTFIPDTPRQIYCKEKHYGKCPVCGKEVEIKDLRIGPQACSEKCRMARINATCLERYGCKDAVNSEHARELSKKHSLERYGKEHYSQTDEFKEKYKSTSLERYGTEYPMQNLELQQKAKDTCVEKYGVDHYMKTQEGKDKVRDTHESRYGGIGLASPELRERITATNREKYGVDFPLASKEIQQKIHDNSLKNHGVYWPATAAEVNEHRNATNLAKYGAINPYGSTEVQQKIREKWTAKYGGPNPMCDPQLVELSAKRRGEAMLRKYGAEFSLHVPSIKKKISDTIQEKYGVPWYVMTKECMEHNYHAVSEVNKKFGACLEALGIDYTFEFYVGRPAFDVHISDTNILIEIDPTYTHNSYDNVWHDPKDKNYHLNKTKLAEDNGYRCIHIFDWDNWEAIISLLVSKQTIYARKCTLSKIDRTTVEQFTRAHHLQGSCRGQNIAYGLYYKGCLVEIMSFGTPRYTGKYDLELLRLCTESGTQVIGGASKLFNAFLRDYPDSSVLSYCDHSKFSGHVYEQLGMQLARVTPPAKVWSSGTRYITDNYLRQRGYDQIFKTNYGKGTSNEQLMLEHGWLPVYDCGQKVFEYIPNTKGGQHSEQDNK